MSSLLRDLSECLMGTSDSGTSPQGSEVQMHSRLRTVLVSLVAECIDSKTGTPRDTSCLLCFWRLVALNGMQRRLCMSQWEHMGWCHAVKPKELATLLNLVNLALERIPRVVRDDNGATLCTIIGHTIHFLAEERLKYVSFPFCCMLYPHNRCSLAFCIAVIGSFLQPSPTLGSVCNVQGNSPIPA